MAFTDREAMILQKLIRHEKEGAYALPHLDEGYVKDLDDLYQKVGGGVDHWEDYD